MPKFAKIPRPYAFRAIGRNVILASVMGGSLTFADVWEYRDDGSVTTHRGLDYEQRAELHLAWRPLSQSALATKRVQFGPLVREVADKYGVDAALVHAVIEVESAYDPHAVSRTGAMGLMQLMPATAERFAVLDPLNPGENIEAGVRYLKILLDEFHDIELVLAAYNAGEKAVRKYGNAVPPYSETKAYVRRVVNVIQASDM